MRKEGTIGYFLGTPKYLGTKVLYFGSVPYNIGYARLSLSRCRRVPLVGR